MAFKSDRQRRKVMMMLRTGSHVNIVSGGFQGMQGIVIGKPVETNTTFEKRGRKTALFPIKVIGSSKIDSLFGKNKFWHAKRMIRIMPRKTPQRVNRDNKILFNRMRKSNVIFSTRDKKIFLQSQKDFFRITGKI